MTQTLLAFDTDRIKQYIFATGQLRDIRGASALLDELNRRRMPEVVSLIAPTARTLYAQGGGGLFLLEEQEAEQAHRAVQRLYLDETHAASISGTTISMPPNSSGQTSIKDQFRTLSYRMRAAKDRTPIATALCAHGLLRPCEICGVDYATERLADEQEALQICRACARKRDEDRRLKRAIAGWLRDPDLRASPADPLWRRLIASLRRNGYPLDGELERPSDFAALADQSSPRGYLGLIYADGDAMGRELEQLTTAADFEHFARSVDESVYDATVDAISAHLRPRGDGRAFGFDVLLLGGDDLVMVTRADAAIETALTLVERFSALTAKRLGHPLRMTAGVVLVHAAFPFTAMRQLAESSVRFAKQQAVDRRQAGKAPATGLLNFVVVDSAAHLDFASYFEQTLSPPVPQHESHTQRTCRPYAPAELRLLMAGIRALKQAPRTKLQQLREACFLSYDAARLEALSALMRWPEGRGKQEVQGLVAQFARLNGEDVQFPWCGHANHWRTPLVDLVDLSEFIPSEGSGNAT